MNSRNSTLRIDAYINLCLGIILLLYTDNLAIFLGVPVVDNYFYPNILGGIFIGIALALFFEIRHKSSSATTGLGLSGAIAINLCGGLILLFWLLFGDLTIPVKGKILLWGLVVLLIVLSSIELFYYLKFK
jgi:hypothetical protein